jgi:RIO-like serine/threonine protein kinase
VIYSYNRRIVAKDLAQTANSKSSPRIAYSMRALGKRDLSPTIDIGGETFRHERTHKHDFWAVTGFYVSDAGRRVVVKVSRTEDFAGMPLKWIGRWLCRREMRFYSALADLGNVPPLLGKIGETGFVHAYVDGRPLSRDRPVPDGFFDQLVALLRSIHGRNIAYVDTNKPENILLGDDGKPHLIDFQISYDLTELGNTWLNRKLLRQLQREDLYHILKHKKRLRPDEMTPEELAGAERQSWLIRLHRFLTKPYFKLRRRTFKRLRDSGRLLPEGSK